jgi:outer membrane protein assembly factor BamB/tetratricopeptide (TPR) repeat protein
MSFCTQCQTYVPPDTPSCPTCGAPRPSATPATPLWSTALDEPPTGPPLVVDDLLLVPTQEPAPPSQHSTLHALSLVDGSERWGRTFEYALVSGLAAVQTSEVSETSEVLVATSSTDLLRSEGALLALDAAGEERWRWSPGVQRVSAPAVTGDVVCVTADARTLITLDASTGNEGARVPLEASASLAAPALADEAVYVPCRGPHLLAVGLDGRPRWRFDAAASPNAWLDQTPTVVGERLFAVLSTGTILALHIEDGSLVWQTDVGPAGKRPSPPTTDFNPRSGAEWDGGRLYIGARDGLHALDLADGREVWAFPTPRRIVAAPVVGGGVVYATCHDHRLYALDATSGRELWRYETGRRIEVTPVITSPPEACALIADRSGTLTAITRPLSAAEHEAAGHWVEGASAYAALGQFARGAALLEAHDEPFKAAELWRAAGEQERAAAGYEAAGAWGQAVELWERLGRPLKRAEALEGHALSLADESYSDEERVAAWVAAAQALEAEGEIERAAACQQEAARYLRQPVITLDVEHEGLALNAWSRLQFVVRNEGHGPARELIIRASGDEFEGQVMATQRITTLWAGREHTAWLDVRPRAYGDNVPLRVSVEYRDRAGELYTREETLYVPVARVADTHAAEQVRHISRVFDIAPSPQAVRLRRILSTHLSLEDFRNLCFDLGVNYDHLGGEGLTGKARELVRHLQRRDALAELIEWLRRERPDLEG